jgi:hypothetical protein
MSSSQRIEFTQAIKQIVAERAGHHCSFRDCNSSTIGPNPGNSRSSIRNGHACHIYPASGSGPRSALTPPDFDLGSLENAIWMCETHASLIDKDGGFPYPPLVLFKLRDQAENRAAVSQRSSSSGSPAIDYLSVHRHSGKSQTFEFEEIRIELTRLAVLYLNHEMPLRFIVQAVSKAAKTPTDAIEQLRSHSLDFTVRYAQGGRAPTRVSLSPEGVRYWDGVSQCVSIDGFYEVVLVDKDTLSAGVPPSAPGWWYEPSNGEDALESLIPGDPMIAGKFIDLIRNEDNVLVRDIRRDEKRWEVSCLGHQPDEYFGLASLSSSELLSVHLDLTLAMIRVRAQSHAERPFLFVIDNLLVAYDANNLARFVDICQRLPSNVQVLITDVSGRVADSLPQYRQDLVLVEKEMPRGWTIKEPPV